MQITMTKISKRIFGSIEISFGEEVLRFEGRATLQLDEPVKLKSDKPEANLFECFNDYLKSVVSPEDQLTLFNLYKEAFNVIEGDVGDYTKDLSAAKKITGKILDLIDVRKYENFIQFSDYLRIPPELGEAARKGDYPVETTITDEDYVHLVRFAFLVRTIYPVIYGLLGKFDPLVGKEGELIMGDIIKDNPYIINHPGWVKLNTYIDFSFNKRGIPTRPDSIGSVENFTDRVLYTTIFNRLCCAVIPERQPEKNLATNISAAIKTAENRQNNFKTKRTSMGEEDKRSIYDKYMISESVRVSDQVRQAEFFSFGLMDENDKPRSKDLFKYQAKALGIKQPELVEAVYDKIPRNWEFHLYPHIHQLLQLVYFGKVSPFIFEACDYTQLMAAIALGQVWLAEQGFQYLPSLLGAIDNPDGPRQLPDVLKLTNDDKDYLASICEVQTRNAEGRSYNEAVVAAANFLDGFANGTWQSNLEYGVLTDEGNIYQRVKEGSLFELEVEREIKDEFMDLNKLINN